MKVQELTLIGFGAIGRAVYQRMNQHERIRITHIVVSRGKVAQLQIELGEAVTVSHQVPIGTPLILECAGTMKMMKGVAVRGRFALQKLKI